jgi:hypothetical protein
LDPIDFNVFNDATPPISPPLPVAEARPPLAPRVVGLNFQVTSNMILDGPHGLITNMKALGIAYLSSSGDGGHLLKKQVLINITNHCKAVYKQESTNYHYSLCFKSPKQVIDRHRMMRPKPFLVGKKTPPSPKVKHPEPRRHKSIPVHVDILSKYKDRRWSFEKVYRGDLKIPLIIHPM